MAYQEKAVTETLDRLLSEQADLDPAAEGALDDVDQFHIGGAAAVGLLIAALDLADGDVVLDVGSGFGGPARQIARHIARQISRRGRDNVGAAQSVGHRVLGIDITPAYVEAARNLTAKAGLADLVDFEVADVAAFQPGHLFQAAITMHVQMSVQDKAAWFGHIARHLAPGARLAVWEVCRPAGRAEPTWPMPWSLDGTDSFLASAEDLRSSIEQAGFATLDWTQRTAWARDWLTETYADGLPDGPALPMLLDDGYSRVINFASAIGDGSVEIWQGSFAKNGD